MRGQADPDVEFQGCRYFPVPDITERRAAQTADAFIEQDSECSRVVAVGSTGFPKRHLSLQSNDQGVMIKNGRRHIERRQSGLMGQQLSEGRVRSQGGPNMRHRRVQCQSRAVQSPQQGGCGRTFGCRPHWNQRMFGPRRRRRFARSSSSRERHNRPRIRPDTKGRSQLAALGEIRRKNIFNT